jgi:hypothetical protein
MVNFMAHWKSINDKQLAVSYAVILYSMQRVQIKLIGAEAQHITGNNHQLA